MSKNLRIKDEELEEIESLIYLLKENVDLFTKENSNQRLNEFISEYINLEDKILEKISSISQSKEMDHEHIENLTNIFNQYWSEYQNTWSQEYWNVYNAYRGFDEKNNNNFNDEMKGILVQEGNDIHIQDMNDNLKQLLSNPQALKSTNEETVDITTVNINKIDEELKDISEISFIKEKKEEKKRGCLDCSIF